MRLAIVVSALLSLPLTSVAAQGPDLVPGARVRVSSAQYGYKKDVATVSQVRGDSLVLLFNGKQTAVATVDLNELEVAVGTRNAILPTAMMGAAAGLLGGAILGFATHKDCDGCFFNTSASDDAFIIGTLGAAAGFVGGAIFGSARKRDRWVPVRTSPTRVSVAPTAMGAVAVSFNRAF